MDLNKVTSKNGDIRDFKGNDKNISVSDEEMNAFSQMLGEKGGLDKASKEMIYSDRDEKKADAEKLKNDAAKLKNGEMSQTKKQLYNSYKDKSILSLGQKSALGLNANGQAKSAPLMNGGTLNLAQLSYDMSKNGAMNTKLTKLQNKGEEIKNKGEVKGGNANLTAGTESKVAPKLDLSQISKAEKAEAERQVKREEVIKQVIDHVELKNFGSKSELTIKMNPEFLGAMKMRLLFEGDKVSAEFNTTSQEVRAALEESSEELAEAMSQKGIKFDKMNVKLVDDIG